MKYLLYSFRFLYRIRWWLILAPTIITLIVIYSTKNLPRTYEVKTTVYTGIVSGYTIESGSVSNIDYVSVSNSMDNLINIIQSENTLKRVSYRLYARNMIHGNLNNDNQYITSSNFQEIYNRTKNNKEGAKLLALIDSTSEDKTFENLLNYEKQDKDNFIYGLFYWNHPHYCYNALKNIKVNRKNNSDLLEISYTSNDPGIVYNTLEILTKEFVNEYRDIRYGETDKVIAYFKGELDRIGAELRIAEDSLTNYNIEKKIINYYDETREVAGINTEYEIREQDATLLLNSSKSLIDQLEKRMDSNLLQIKNNIDFINKLNQVSSLTGVISEIQSFNSEEKPTTNVTSLKKQLDDSKKELSEISNQYIENKYSKEGISKSSIVSQWLEQILVHEKAKSDLQVIRKNREDLNDRYVFFAPVGSTLKRKERNINFTEQNYLSVLKSYNDALMRKKNLEMTSATLKVLNPPAYPIQAQPTKRKTIVVAAFFGSILLILGFFVLLEIIDRTLHDKVRSELFTNLPVIGAFPDKSLIKYRNYDNEVKRIATKYLSSSILPYLVNTKEGLPFIINFLSTEARDGKSYLINELISYWSETGLKIKYLKWDEDFDIYSPGYLMAKSVSDLYQSNNEDILIVEYPELKSNNIASNLLNEANINLVVVRATRGWKESDSILIKRISNQLIDKEIKLYLNRAERYVVEGFTGMLPPYNKYRRLIYRLLHLELTAKYESSK